MPTNAPVLLSRRLQQPRRCPCSCRPTGRAPMSRPAGILKDTPTRAGRTGPGGRMASTTTRLPSGCCIPGLVQLPPTAARSAAKSAVNRRKSGVGCHSLTQLATHMKRFLPTKSAIADAMGCRCTRGERRFTSNSSVCRRQLRLWTSGAVKLLLVTGKRGRRRRDMGRGPLGPVQ
jgi:hypothetical protein